MDQLTIAFEQAALPEPPVLAVMVPKATLIECADRELKKGRVDLAFGLEQLTALIKDGQLVPISRELAERIGIR